jgi:hypothetical protein
MTHAHPSLSKPAAILAVLAIVVATPSVVRAQDEAPQAAPHDLSSRIAPIGAPQLPARSRLALAAFTHPSAAVEARSRAVLAAARQQAELQPKAEWVSDEGMRVSGAGLAFKTRF